MNQRERLLLRDGQKRHDFPPRLQILSLLSTGLTLRCEGTRCIVQDWDGTKLEFSAADVVALNRDGLVAQHERDKGVVWFVITGAGRSALAAGKGAAA